MKSKKGVILMMPRVSFDYEDLIGDLEEDMMLDDIPDHTLILVVRRSRPLVNNYYPIVEYYLPGDEAENDEDITLERHEYMPLEKALKEMHEWNDIFHKQ
ncbi:MAG: hypothetical protein WC110_10220 [Bacteroidales bacterium]